MIIKIIKDALTSRLLIIAAALVMLLHLVNVITDLKQEIDRITDNYKTAIGQTENDLELSRKEFSDLVKSNKELEQVLRDCLEVKDKQIKRLSSISGKTEIRYKVTLRDTTIYKTDTVPLYARTFSFKDNWIDSRGIVFPDTVELHHTARDSIFVVTYWYKDGKWFLPKLFSPKKYTTDVTWRSPYAQYHVTQSVEVMKKAK